MQVTASYSVVEVYPSATMAAKANYLMKTNVDALLRRRHYNREDLSRYCRREVSWASKILNDERRWFPMKYWDRISDFFGVATYQLLQPGAFSVLTERRRGDRRSGKDRRVRDVAAVAHNAQPLALAVAQEVLTLDQEDVGALAVQIAELKRRRIAGSSTGRVTTAPDLVDQQGDAIWHAQKKTLRKRSTPTSTPRRA